MPKVHFKERAYEGTSQNHTLLLRLDAVTKLASRLRHLRETRHLNQEQVAEKLSMQRASYTKLETAKANVTLPRLRQIEDVLDLSEPERLALLLDWIEATIGPADFACLTISTGYQLREHLNNDREHLLHWLRGLDVSQSAVLLKAKDHPGFFDLLRAALRVTRP